MSDTPWCACRVMLDGTVVSKDSAGFCFLHEAAPDLHAALEAAPEPKRFSGTLPELAAYIEWYDGPRAAALAKARGESNPAKAARVEHVKRLLEQGR